MGFEKDVKKRKTHFPMKGFDKKKKEGFDKKIQQETQIDFELKTLSLISGKRD